MQGGFSKAYNEHGVDKFYEQSADNYSNPHKYDIERLIKKKLGKGNVYLQVKASILDLACGNG